MASIPGQDPREELAWAPRDPELRAAAPPHTPGGSDIELLEKLAENPHTHTQVWRARWSSLGVRDTVAVKILHSVSPERIRRELDLLIKLRRQKHTNIVTVYEVRPVAEQTVWIIMEYCELRSLGHRRAQMNGPLPVGEVLAAGIGIADALYAVHKEGAVHRDIKPANILIRSDDREAVSSYLLADFGTARLLDSEMTNSAREGTWTYASPQHREGRRPSTGDDIWSLGATMYTLLDGNPPIPGISAKLKGDLPGKLAEVIGRCLQPEPAGRFPDMASLGNALTEIRNNLAGWPADTAWAPSPPGFVHPSPSGSLHAPAPATAPELPGASALAHAGIGVDATGTLAEPAQATIPPPTRAPKRRRLILAGLAALVAGTTVGVLLARLPGQGPNSQPPPQASGSPTNATAGPVGWAPVILDVADRGLSAELVWRDNSDSRAKFVLLVEADGGSAEKRGEYAAGTTQATVSNLDPAVRRYCFALLALRDGQQALSEPRCITRLR